MLLVERGFSGGIAVMETEFDGPESETVTLLGLRVVSEADPGALFRVLERFQGLNITPRRVIAEFAAPGTLFVQVELTQLSEHRLGLITAKIRQVPCVLNAYWHRL